MESKVTRWRCDVCGEWISPAQGYVLWNLDVKHARHGFQIVHQKKCDKKNAIASAALGDFLGPDGFARCTALMTVGPIMRNQSPDSEFRQRIADSDEFADFMRRLYVPNYEEARPMFNDPAVLDEMHGSSESRPYFQDQLQYVAKKAK